MYQVHKLKQKLKVFLSVQNHVTTV